MKTQVGTLPSEAQLRHLIQALKPGSDEGVFRERQKGTYSNQQESRAQCPGRVWNVWETESNSAWHKQATGQAGG